MPLTDTAIRSAKPGTSPRKLHDDRGLFLLLQPSGARWWRFKYRFQGKEKSLSFGVYPDVSLKEARERRDEARRLVAADVDPSAARKAAKSATAARSANTFEAVADEWFKKQATQWAASHATKIKSRLDNHVLPWLGKRPIAEIEAPELLETIRRVEDQGVLETAHRVRTICGQIFRYAIATGRARSNPAPELRGALTPWQPEHYPSITKPSEVGALLRAMDDLRAGLVVKSALRLLPLVFLRPGELRKAEWAEFDLDAATWNIPAERMKGRRPHLVPLSSQAVTILQALQPLTGSGSFVFPGGRSAKKPLSENAVNAALRRTGYGQDEMTGHGFRAMARTILDEVLGFRVEWIEHQLAHEVRDANGRAYNRTAFEKERRDMMQRWADYLDELRSQRPGTTAKAA